MAILKSVVHEIHLIKYLQIWILDIQFGKFYLVRLRLDLGIWNCNTPAPGEWMHLVASQVDIWDPLRRALENLSPWSVRSIEWSSAS